MRKLAFFLGLAIAIFVSTQVASATQVINDALQVKSLKVGQQGVGGVTYFNGTIINETTDATTGADMPLTVGDGLRVDGVISRGASAESGDETPVKFEDDVNVNGLLYANGIVANGAIITDIYYGAEGYSLESDIDSIVNNSNVASVWINDIISYEECIINQTRGLGSDNIEYDIVADCWNTYIAGKTLPVSLSGSSGDSNISSSQKPEVTEYK
jgi:hypothetical protein